MLRFDATGRGVSAGHTLMKPGPTGSVAVTFRTAPVASAAAGPRSTMKVPPDGTGASVRVSSTRVGVTGTRRPAEAVTAGCQAPMTSMAMCVALWVNTSTEPASPSGTITMFGNV